MVPGFVYESCTDIKSGANRFPNSYSAWPIC